MPLQALIWDVDGTLADTELHGHRVAFNLAFAEAGLPWHWDEALYLDLLAVTGGKERIQAWWQRVDPLTAAAPTTAQRIRALHARKTAHYTARVAAGQVVLRPGVQRLITEARAAGLRQAIATTTSPDNVQALLAATLGPQAEGWFEVVGAGDVVPHKKPAPDIYHWVLERLALPAAACVAIEDSTPGVAAALAAGLPTLLTRSGASARDRLLDPPASPGTGWLLADLDGLGMPGQPAAGRAGGQAWRGVVDIGWLRQRWAALPDAQQPLRCRTGS
jgi:HAD superfamily hydrolase (TIGR01509 family)